MPTTSAKSDSSAPATTSPTDKEPATAQNASSNFTHRRHDRRSSYRQKERDEENQKQEAEDDGEGIHDGRTVGGDGEITSNDNIVRRNKNEAGDASPDNQRSRSANDDVVFQSTTERPASGDGEHKAMKTQQTASEPLPARAGSAPVVKPFVECPSCGKIWPYDGHAADVCCGGCSHNFYVPPDAMVRRLLECESVLRSVVKNVPIMVSGFRGTLLHSKCVALVGEQNVSDQATLARSAANTQPTE